MTSSAAKNAEGILFFSPQGLRRRVFLTQLPLALIMVVAVLIAAVVYPKSFHETWFMASLVMHVLLLVASIAVPWERLPHGAYLIIPYLDFVAIGLLRGATGNQQFLAAVSLLVFFPVFWLASWGLAKRTSVIASVIAALLIVWVPVVTSSDGFTVDELLKPLLFPLVVFAFAMTVVAMTNTVTIQRQSLEAKDNQLRTALEESQQRERLLETVVDTVAVGLVVVDAHGKEMLTNATHKSLHAHALPEFTSAALEEDLLVFAVETAIPVPAEDRPVSRAIKGEKFTDYQLWLGSGDNAKAVSASARPMKDEQGNFDGAVIAFHDVTEMINVLEAKNDFVSNVSHEFRTPLTSIQGYLEIVLEQPDELSSETHHYLSIASRNVDRLSALVEDLLITDSVTLQVARTDVAQLISESLGSAAPAAEINKVALHSQVTTMIDARVDARRVGQVLDNLVSNAVKYSPDGGTVTVRAWAEENDLWCEVQDTGLGMSAEEQAEVFTKFFRAKSAVQRSIPGIGLGLMISKTIVAKHGGTISLHSERGKGTTISFVLPGCLVPSNSSAGLIQLNVPELKSAQ